MIYQNYHKHDYYTNPIVPDSPVSPRDYAERAVALGHGIISSVNHGWAGRYIEHYELAKEFGLKFVFGTEAYIVKDRHEKDNTNAHLILLAKNENGRKAINRIISEANVSGFYYRARIDFELLYSLPKDDVWVSSGCVGGVWKYENHDELIVEMHKYFKDNFFLEVQSHNTDSQKSINSKIINLSNQHGIKIIFGCDSHYIFPEQSQDRDDYLASKNMFYEDEVGWYMDYPDGETVIERFQEQGILNKYQIEEAMQNTNILLNVEEYTSCVFSPDMKLPTLYPNASIEERNEILENLIWSEWDKEKENVLESLWPTYEKEIWKELDIITETGMADYFLVDYEVVKRGVEKGGQITLTSRGSSAGFYVTKLLGFSTIDRIASPVKLFPERFITKERILEAHSLPDIDFNLGDPETFAEAQKETLGNDHSYPMLAYGTMRPKAAWKMYARAKEIDFEVANNISSQIGDYEKSLRHNDEAQIEDFIDKNYLEYYEDSKKYLGIVASVGLHPCAYLLFQENIPEEIGLVKIKSHLCCNMDGMWAEKYGFLKNDFLKVSSVELIYKVYDRIGIKPHDLPELMALCENNQKVWDVYKNAWVMGVNQVEQTSTSGRVAKYAPTNISELSAFVAAIRPGFQSNYKQFEAREPFSYGVPSLDKLIQTSEFPYSYMLYQENAMAVLEYAGVPPSKTYEVVKNIAKKRVEKVLGYKDLFLEGMKKRLIDDGFGKESEKVAKMTWQIIEDSSHYNFNAAHSYSMAGDSIYGAYLKSHYPLEFYETFLRILEDGGDKDRLRDAKVEAQKAYGIKFPALEFGQDNRTLVANEENRSITSSLKSIKGFSTNVSDNIWELSQVEHQDFLSLLIYAEEHSFLSKKFEELIKINYFKQFGNNKKLLLCLYEFVNGKSRYSAKHKDATKEKRVEGLKEIFANIPDERLPFFEQIIAEEEILGYVTSTYPVDKRYVYVLEVVDKFSPRLQTYCLNNGTQASLKVQKKLFERNMVRGGDILYIKNFKKKPSYQFVDGKFIEKDDGSVDWWIENYKIMKPDEFDEILGENS